MTAQPLPNTQEEAVRAAEALANADPLLAPSIAACAPLALTPTSEYFFTLVDAIASQQLSAKVAATIVARIRNLAPDGKEAPDAADILALPEQMLRDVGLSWGKVRYVRDLSERVVSGRLDLKHISSLDDEEAIRQLVEVKGIGRWTAEMFLIFSLARPDVLAVDDYGIRMAMQRIYSLPELPKPGIMREIGEAWRPYRSYASLYLWHGHDSSPKVAEMQVLETK